MFFEDVNETAYYWEVKTSFHFRNSNIMKTVECPSCAMDVEATSEECPICGYEFPKQSKSLIIAVWIMIALMILYFIF